jgi:hypothetical protein
VLYRRHYDTVSMAIGGMCMASETLEARLSVLEREMAQIKRLLRTKSGPAEPWWERIAGVFEDDPVFEQAMKLGRQYRESLRPRRGEQRGRKNGGSRHRSS